MTERLERDDAVAVPPLVADPAFADPLLADAVDDAVAGNPLLDVPEAQPARRLTSTADFASLYVRHRSSFELHARRFSYDQRDVDEVVQETFLRLFLAMPEIETELQALAFGRRVLTNLCIDRYRADRRRPRLVDLDEATAYDIEDDEALEDPVLRAEDAAIVRQALSLLSPLHRAALIKREIEEKPLPQIAAELDVPEESVKHLLHRARRALRRLLVGTTVEPGVELTNAQLLRLANERLARATMRGAGVVLVTFVAIVSVVGGLRTSVRSTESGASVPNGVVSGLGSLVSPPDPRLPRLAPTGVPHHRARKHVKATPVVATPPVVAPTVAPAPVKHAPVVHAPVKPPVHVAPTGRPPFALHGATQVLGPVVVHSLGHAVTPEGDVTSTSEFVARTTDGTFSLAQSVTQAAASDAAVVSLTPSWLTTAGQQASVAVMQSTAAVQPDSDGNIRIDYAAATTTDPGAQSPVPAVSGMRAQVVLSPDLGTVLSETVTLQTTGSPLPQLQPVAASQPSAVAPVAPAAPPATVIGMSPVSSDDQEQSCASFDCGGSSSALPTPLYGAEATKGGTSSFVAVTPEGVSGAQ